jgi:hypothetical protein
MARETQPNDDRGLARHVVENGNHRYAASMRGKPKVLTDEELDYLRWLYEKVQAEKSG